MTLTHFDAGGRARMVDVGGKAETERAAVARAHVALSPDALKAVLAGTAAKGDVIGVARIAGILAAKRTAELIPLCHPLSLSAVTVDLGREGEGLFVEAAVRTTGRTGVEMEALTAASVAALTVYDMCKSLDRAIRITDLRVVRKEGGKSGVFVQP